jgi:carbonic anhydrase
LIETSTATNAALTAYTVQQELDRAAVQSVRAVYGVYLLQTRGIWTPSADSQALRLAEPPPDLPSFIQFGSDLIHSDRINALLQTG